MSFLRNAYLKDSRNSLQAANAAAVFVSEELGARYNPSFEYSDIERRWHEFSQTNHLLTVTTTTNNQSTNTVYDIISSTEANRLIILTNWGETKLVLFKLRYPAIPRGTNTVDAMCLDYTFSNLKQLIWIETFRDAIWAKFNNWEQGCKCEFKYERDFSSTNVQSFSYVTNSLILDGSIRWQGP